MSLVCGHCGLSFSGRPPAGGEDAYCCLGCRFAARIAGGDDRERRWLESKLLVSAFLAMGVMTFSLVLWGEKLYVTEPDPGMGLLRNGLRGILALFSLPVFVLLGPDIVRGALADLRRGAVRMDGLILVATFAAWILSALHTMRGDGEVYFETATMVLVVVMFGRRLEAHAKTRGRDAAELLADFLPEHAHRGGEDVDPAVLVPGDAIRILPAEAVPADVRITRGSSAVSAAHLTGEEAALDVGPGDEVPAGSILTNGLLEAVVVRPWVDGGLGRIRDLLVSPIPMTGRTRSVDRLAGWIVGVTIVIALGAALRAALAIGPDAAVRTGLAVLLVACPCALGLATPLSYRAIRAALAKRGVLIRDPAALEAAACTDRLVFDKTGTLTETYAIDDGLGEARSRRELMALARDSNHTLGRAMAGGGPRAEELTVVPGRGLRARIDARDVVVGNPDWLDHEGAHWSAELGARRRELEQGGASVVALASGGEVEAIAGIGHRVRPSARDSLAALEASGLAIEIVSGDRDSAVAQVASELGADYRAGMTPEAKVACIEELQSRRLVVAMIGDGVNDAPALRAADVGIAVGDGTAVARSESAVELIGGRLESLPLLFAAARLLRRTVRGNLAWALAYNVVAVAFAAAGRLHPLLAVALMVTSSLVVSLRSYRLVDFGKAT